MHVSFILLVECKLRKVQGFLVYLFIDKTLLWVWWGHVYFFFTLGERVFGCHICHIFPKL